MIFEPMFYVMWGKWAVGVAIAFGKIGGVDLHVGPFSVAVIWSPKE